jgi:hypothetical protein
VGAQENYLEGVALDARRNVWAVGYSSNNGSNQRTMIMRHACLP